MQVANTNASPPVLPMTPQELQEPGSTPLAGKVYVQQVVDRDTGEVSWVNLGTFRPLSAVADMLGIGRRKFREVLLSLGVVQQEYDEYSRQNRHRLSPWAVESGLGRRIDRKHLRDHQPFDVLSEDGVAYVRDHLLQATMTLEGPARAARDALVAFEARRTLDSAQRVSWLADHYPALSQQDVSEIVGVSEGRVSQLLDRRASRLRWLKAKQAEELPWKEMAPERYAEHLTP